MDQEINEDEVLSDSQSSSTTRPSSSSSSDMPTKSNIQSRSESFTKRQSSNIDINDISLSINKQIPVKILIVNGKCSNEFKSALEDCVEDCILEFPNEPNTVYVSKPGQAIQIPSGTNRNSIMALREQNITGRQSAKSNRRRNSINQYNSLPQIGNTRTNIMSNFTLPTTALAATAAARMRHQLVQQKFSFAEDISEETSEQQIITEQPSTTNPIESEIRSERPSIFPEESITSIPNPNIGSLSLSSYPYYSIPSAKTNVSYRDRQKDYRLSDLVMLGPEYFAPIFNLSRHHSQSRQQNNRITEKSTELDRIKQDLFHRYLWTQKPQVSCRIRPLSTYARSTTFVI